MSKIVTSTHRLSYVHLDKPYAFKNDNGEDGKANYTATLLIPKEHPDVARLTEIMRGVHASEATGKFKGLPFTSTKLWNPLRDGDEEADVQIAKGKKEELWQHYRGCYFLKISSSGEYPAPVVLDADRNEVLDVRAEVYSGSYGRADLSCKAFNNKQIGFGFYINSVMKTKDGERLGGLEVDLNAYDEEVDYSDANATRKAPVTARLPVAPPARVAPPAAPSRPIAPARPPIMWEKDEDDADIYSEDGGVTWAYGA